MQTSNGHSAPLPAPSFDHIPIYINGAQTPGLFGYSDCGCIVALLNDSEDQPRVVMRNGSFGYHGEGQAVGGRWALVAVFLEYEAAFDGSVGLADPSQAKWTMADTGIRVRTCSAAGCRSTREGENGARTALIASASRSTPLSAFCPGVVGIAMTSIRLASEGRLMTAERAVCDLA